MIPKLSDRKQMRLPGTKGLGRGLTAKILRERFREMKLLVFVCEDSYGFAYNSKIHQPVPFVRIVL